MPVRCSTNHSNSRSGSSRSTTAVIGMSTSANQAPPHSQLPTCGSAMTMPRSSAATLRRISSPSPVTIMRATMASGVA